MTLFSLQPDRDLKTISSNAEKPLAPSGRATQRTTIVRIPFRFPEPWCFTTHIQAAGSGKLAAATNHFSQK